MPKLRGFFKLFTVFRFEKPKPIVVKHSITNPLVQFFILQSVWIAANPRRVFGSHTIFPSRPGVVIPTLARLRTPYPLYMSDMFFITFEFI